MILEDKAKNSVLHLRTFLIRHICYVYTVDQERPRTWGVQTHQVNKCAFALEAILNNMIPDTSLK